MNNLEMKTVELQSRTVFYYELGEVGKGEDIIISHGAFFNGSCMLEYAELWAKAGNHVIVLNLPGRLKADRAMNAFEVLTDTVIEFIKALQEMRIITKKPIMQGWSLGGALAQAIALIEPNLLKVAVIICSDSSWPNISFPPFPEDEVAKKELLEMVLNGSVSVGTTQEKLAELIESIPTASAGGLACNNDLHMVKQVRLDGMVGEIKIPLIIISGETDVLTTPDRQLKLRDAIPGSKQESLVGAGHMIVLEDPVRVYNSVNKMMPSL